VKRIFSILTVFLVLAATLHISVARHYCGGEFAASKISLSGDLASCGMEGTEKNCPLHSAGDHLKSHCCDDVVTYFSIDNNYTQSQQTVFAESYRFISHFPEISIASPLYISNLNYQVFTGVSPPDYLMYTAVDLTSICVFRI
jgi:hypothetical protein